MFLAASRESVDLLLVPLKLYRDVSGYSQTVG